MATKLPTKKAMREIAFQARRYGFYREDPWHGYVRCPECRGNVHATRTPAETLTESTWGRVLDAAMLEHLPACHVMRAAKGGEDLSRVPLEALDAAIGLAPLNSPEERTLRDAYTARAYA